MTDITSGTVLSQISEIINYELIPGNAVWRFGVVLIVLLAAMAAGKIAQFMLLSAAGKRASRGKDGAIALVLRSFSGPASIAFFGIGLLVCRSVLVFADAADEGAVGISASIGVYWTKISLAVVAIAVAYALYRLVDVAEYYLLNMARRTQNKLDDMLVPVVRKSLKVTIAIISVLYIADGILGAEIKAILLSAGVGGIAVALAAKDTIANFFGSVTIFADKPFEIDDLVEIEGHLGPVEEVGFRSTKVRTLAGSLVTIPNNTIANSVINNVGKRSFIRRTSNITITYDSGFEKANQAVAIIKNILAETEEVNQDSERPPRVYFNEFNDCSLNIYMSYWVKPADYWLYLEVNERVNFEMLRRFDEGGIEFAFPTQTLYLKKDDEEDETRDSAISGKV